MGCQKVLHYFFNVKFQLKKKFVKFILKNVNSKIEKFLNFNFSKYLTKKKIFWKHFQKKQYLKKFSSLDLFVKFQFFKFSYKHEFITFPTNCLPTPFFESLNICHFFWKKKLIKTNGMIHNDNWHIVNVRKWKITIGTFSPCCPSFYFFPLD